MSRRGARRWLRAAVTLLVLVSVAASVTYFVREPANLGFLDHPAVVGLHVALGAVYIMIAPFQFVERIRNGHISYHRAAGRVLVAVGLVVGVTALFLGLVIPFSGWPEAVLIGVFGTLFLYFLIRGYTHPREAGDLAPGLHDEGLRHRARPRDAAGAVHPSPPRSRRSDAGPGGPALGGGVGYRSGSAFRSCRALDPSPPAAARSAEQQDRHDREWVHPDWISC
jgi:hypothetical protein